MAALPEEMRQEVIRDHLIQQQMNAATNTQVEAENDLPPERLAAIIGMEVPEGFYFCGLLLQIYIEQILSLRNGSGFLGCFARRHFPRSCS